MIEARPPEEAQRLLALRRYDVLDTPPEEAFDDVARLAAQICDAPIALVCLVDDTRLWFKAAVGLETRQVRREASFCARAIGEDGPLVVPDARADARFADSPLVTGEPGVRFYAGVPLRTPDGHAIGTLCVLDRAPRTLGPGQVEALRSLSRQVVGQLELRRNLGELHRVSAERERSEEALRASETHFRAVVETAGDAIITADARGRITQFNRAAERIFGHAAAEAIDAPLAILIPERFREAHRQGFARFFATGETRVVGRTVELAGLHKDGHEFPLEMSLAAWRTGEGTFVSAILRDVTERKKIELEKVEWEKSRLARHVQRLLESTGEGIWGIDLEGRCTFINQSGADLLGYATAEVVGRNMHELVHHSRHDGSPYPVEECPIYRAFHDGKGVRVEGEALWRRDGTSFVSQYSSFPVVEDGAIAGAVVTFQDISERKELERRLAEQLDWASALNVELVNKQSELAEANVLLERLAGTDVLTGLHNRRSFQESLSRDYSFAVRQGLPLSMILIDVDHFKAYNDSHGHPAGDEVLREVAALLLGCVREHDVVSRYGGEEFGVLLPGTAAAAGRFVAERIRSAVAGHRWASRPVSVSVGVATVGPTTESASSLVVEADEALYGSKRRGRNRVTHHHDLGLAVGIPLSASG